jgi:chemotaxis protein CheY-P-specific phosphatase CheC
MSAATTRQIPAAELERLRGLAALAAQRAAGSLSDFLGVAAQAGEPREFEPDKLPGCDTGVIFAVEGWLAGHVALFFDTLSRRALIRLLLDEEEPEAPGDMVASGLCELSNILASQAVSMIADAHGGRISLSVPDLSLELATGRFCELRAARGRRAGALAFASEIAAGDLDLRILLVVAPDL